MIDLHTHTIWSDGALIPSEHIRRAMMKGCTVIGITDHADSSNIDTLCRESIKFADNVNQIQKDIIVIPGVELTHVLPKEMKELTDYARENGMKLIVVHGETVVEPVRKGTNLAAIEAKVDILAHPGFITEDEMKLARDNNVCIEITARKGHSLTNGYVAALASKVGAKMVINTDTHLPDDFIDDEFAEKVLLGCGLNIEQARQVKDNSKELVARLLNNKMGK